MRNIAAFLSATILAVALTLGANSYISKRGLDTPVKIAQVSGDMTQETRLHLIKSSFRISTPTGAGTGFAVFSGQRNLGSGDSKYYSYLVTCAHVTKMFQSVVVEKFHYENNRRIFASTHYNGNVILLDTANDLALIEVSSDTQFRDIVNFVSPAEFKRMQLGAPVWVVGCGLADPPYVSSPGYIASFDSDGSIRVTSPLIFGNSGGGVYTADGKVIGVCRALPIIRGWGQVYPNYGYCVPVWTVDTWLRTNGFGFLNNAQDGSSLDRVFDIRERAELEASRIQSERAMKKMLEDLIKKLAPPEPETKPEEKPNVTPNKLDKSDPQRNRHQDDQKKKNRWLFR